MANAKAGNIKSPRAAKVFPSPALRKSPELIMGATAWARKEGGARWPMVRAHCSCPKCAGGTVPLAVERNPAPAPVSRGW
ncbi:hypothetical protein GCM10009628_41160 [Paeniglutamicibacter kerguelensis]